MTVLPHAEGQFVPGTWRSWLFGPLRLLGAVVTCPACAHAMSVGGGHFGSVHTIAASGSVSPSLVCRWCGWHVHVHLAGWSG